MLDGTWLTVYSLSIRVGIPHSDLLSMIEDDINDRNEFYISIMLVLCKYYESIVY